MEEAKDVTVVDNYTLATATQRLLAFGIDYLICSLVFFIPVPYLGALFSVLYLLTRDGWSFLNYKSIGKKIINIRVIKGDNTHINFVSSVKRNLVFIPNLLLIFTHEHLYYAVLLIDLVILAIEVYLIYTSDDSQRLGDNIADTLVIQDDI